MASGKSTYWANKALDLIFGATPYTPPATLYFALFLTSPSSDGGGTEITASEYRRAAVANNSVTWPAAAGGSKSNAVAISFPGTSVDWGTVVAIAVFDAATGGNMITYGTLQTAQPIHAGDTARFPIFGITFVES